MSAGRQAHKRALCIRRWLKRDPQLLQNALKVFIPKIIDDDLAFFRSVFQLNLCFEGESEALLNIGESGFLGRGESACFAARVLVLGSAALDEFLCFTNAHLPFDDLAGEHDLLIGLFEAKEDFGVANGKDALGDKFLDFERELEKAQAVRDRGAGFSEAFGNGFLSETKVRDEAGVAFGLFEGIEVFALKILDQRHDRTGGIVCLDDPHRNALHPQLLAGAPTAFTGDEFKVTAYFPHDNGL